MQKSRGTAAWIAECNRLLDRCAALANQDHCTAAGESFEMIFALLRRIDEGYEDVIFFADEAGSWQVGVDWRKILPIPGMQIYGYSKSSIDDHCNKAGRIGIGNGERAQEAANRQPGMTELTREKLPPEAIGHGLTRTMRNEDPG